MNEHLHLGAVFQPDWNDCPIRVLVFDHVEVMYDYWLHEENKWSLSSLKGTLHYYRHSTEFLLKRAKYVRTDSLTPEEFKIHRPDLPLRIAQSANSKFSALFSASLHEFTNVTDANNSIMQAASISIDTPKLYLSPFGKKGSTKPGVLITAQNSIGFTEGEILWHAYRLQAPFLGSIPLCTGVGIHRLGLKAELPTFYIWGAKSMTEEVKK